MKILLSLQSRKALSVWSVLMVFALGMPASVWADEKKTDEGDKASASASDKIKAESSSSGSSESASSKSEDSPESKYPPFAKVTKDAKAYSGLFKLYEKDNHLFAEIPSSQFDKDFIILISIAKGIGQSPLLGGMSWGFGDDWVWHFRKVGENIHVVRRNVRFTAKSGSPEEKAVALAYTDSVLFSLPIVTTAPSGSVVVDLSQVFMSDLPQISRVLPGFSFASNKSNWAAIKAYPNNIELQIAATYASGGSLSLDSVADSRGVTINVHYSISELKKTSYQPRLADDRIGYFLTVLKDYSKKDGEDDRFVRYINRWDLQKADPSADLSPPKEPIIFWLEKTIPYKYRAPIREGILEWNKAFEKAGFVNAIEVRQQPDDATWDPEDINYNTFRWITASAGFAMGPSRVNPHTGQILDADIIFDADFLNYWKQEYETFTPEGIAAMTGGPLDLKSYHEMLGKMPEHLRHGNNHANCSLCQQASGQLAFGAAVIGARKQSPEDLEEMIMQALKDVTMHEVGHTLGLRHNFKASRMYSLKDLNNPAKTAKTGVTASVMDYTPANIQPKDAKQGDYYSKTIGPYDIWAIEYGYKPLGNSTQGDKAELQKIAARSGEPNLAYATDEDTRGIDPDPSSNRFDLGNDGIEFAKNQSKLVQEAWPDVVTRMTDDGDGYQQARRAFGVLLGTYGRSMYVASRYVGGLYVTRSHKGDKDAAAPFVVVPVEKQRAALELLENNVFSDKPFQFPPELYNHLAATHWSHWGMHHLDRPDYPAHRVVSLWQDRILQQLMSPLTLERLHDSELKVPADQDAFTTAELLERLTTSIFSETNKLEGKNFTNRKPAISSLRRNLQRTYLKRLSHLAMGQYGAPEDCQTVAYLQLVSLEGAIQSVLKGNTKLDTYSRAHLEESASRIRKVIEARLTLSSP
jgi:hypothetical protein